jgi:hypothetical protein
MGRIIQTTLCVVMIMLCGCARSGLSSTPCPPKESVSDRAGIVAAHDELLVALQAEHAQSHSLTWNVATDHMFAWSDDIKEKVAEFIMQPGAAQEVCDDLAAHPDGDRALSNLQISFVMCIILTPSDFQQVDSSRFRDAYRAGNFRPLIEKYTKQDVQFFFDGLNERLNSAGISKKQSPNQLQPSR